MRTFLIWISALIFVLLVSVAGLGAYLWWDVWSLPDISGRVVIQQTTASPPGEQCTAGWVFADIYAGSAATAHDESGRLLGRGELGKGTRANGACIFFFTIPDVHEAEVYTIRIGALGIRALTVSAEEIERNRWQVQYVYGSPAGKDQR